MLDIYSSMCHLKWEAAMLAMSCMLAFTTSFVPCIGPWITCSREEEGS
jgi:hypothetical protein